MSTTTAHPNDADLANPTCGVLLITNHEQTPADSYGYTVAVTLAAKTGVPVTLYDRSEETWGDSQHPEGPMRTGDEQLADREELSEQIAWLEEHGVTGQGWVATLPSISAVLTALAKVDADLVIVPADLGRNLFERVLEGGSLAETLAEQISRNDEVEAAVIEIDENGGATLVAAMDPQ